MSQSATTIVAAALQLAHGDPDKIRGTYNKAQYLEPRRKMMQEWRSC